VVMETGEDEACMGRSMRRAGAGGAVVVVAMPNASLSMCKRTGAARGTPLQHSMNTRLSPSIASSTRKATVFCAVKQALTRPRAQPAYLVRQTRQ
jgi:hypothetical protein